jgi:hypothetical protein
MAVLSTSGTYVYSASVVNLLTASLRIAQIIGEEETPSGAQLQNAMDAFSAMVKGWQASQIHLWCEEECILFPNPAQPIYQLGAAAGNLSMAAPFEAVTFTTIATTALANATSIVVAALASDEVIAIGDTIGIQLTNGTNFWTTVSSVTGSTIGLNTGLPASAVSGAIVFDFNVPLVRPLRVMGGRRYNYLSRIDIPMNMWARLDYQSQPNKYTSGVITAFFYDPQTAGYTNQQAYTGATGVLNLWPNPSDNSNGFRFTSQRPLQDLSDLANLPDFPVEWNAALKWNLAMEIGPEYGTPVEQMQVIDKQATKWFGMASQWDRESESILVGVAWAPGYRRG